MYLMSLAILGTYTTLERTTVDIVAAQLANSHCCILVGIHLDESEPPIRLEASLDNISEVLEEWDQVILGGIRSQITDVASCLPCWGLLNNHIVALNSMGGKVMVAEGSGRSHAHCRHCLLLRDGWLSLLIRPVASNSARPKPFAIHRTKCLLCILTLAEGNKSISSGAPSLHIPHDASLRHRAKGGESLEEDFIIDLVREIANEDVEVVGSVLLVRCV